MEAVQFTQQKGLHYYVNCFILDQLRFPVDLRRQPHIENIAVIQMGGDQGMSDYEKGFLDLVDPLLWKPTGTWARLYHPNIFHRLCENMEGSSTMHAI